MRAAPLSIAVALALSLTSFAVADEPGHSGLRDEQGSGPEPSSPPPPEPAPPEQRPGAEPEPAPTAAHQLEADVWIETWFNRSIDIHKVLPDGERGRKTAKLFYNFSIDAYVRDTSRPFHYVVLIDGAKVIEGDATFDLHWVTSVEAESWNVTVQLTQAGQSKTARWDRIVGVPGEDYGIGEKGPGDGDPLPPDITVPRGYITRLTWTIVLGNIAMMVASFVIVGGAYLEKVQRIGWQRWMG